MLATIAPFPWLGLALLLCVPCCLVRASESWHVTPGAGVLLFPGGQPTHGYDFAAQFFGDGENLQGGGPVLTHGHGKRLAGGIEAHARG